MSCFKASMESYIFAQTHTYSGQSSLTVYNLDGIHFHSQMNLAGLKLQKSGALREKKTYAAKSQTLFHFNCLTTTERLLLTYTRSGHFSTLVFWEEEQLAVVSSPNKPGWVRKQTQQKLVMLCLRSTLLLRSTTELVGEMLNEAC